MAILEVSSDGKPPCSTGWNIRPPHRRRTPSSQNLGKSPFRGPSCIQRSRQTVSLQTTATSHLRAEKHMPDQDTNQSAVAEQSQVPVLRMALPSAASQSAKLLRRIATLLLILVAGLLTVFGYYASSICITVILAGFLAILFDPLVVILEKLHLPRGVAAAGIVREGCAVEGIAREIGIDLFQLAHKVVKYGKGLFATE